MAEFTKVGGSISASQTQGSVDLRGSRHLLLINDGSNSVYVVINNISGSLNTTAATTDFELKSGESLIVDSDTGFSNVLHICSTGLTATVRYLGWY